MLQRLLIELRYSSLLPSLLRPFKFEVKGYALRFEGVKELQSLHVSLLCVRTYETSNP